MQQKLVLLIRPDVSEGDSLMTCLGGFFSAEMAADFRQLI